MYEIGARLRKRERAMNFDRLDSAQDRGLLADCKALRLQVQETTDSKIELLQHVEALSTAERALATELGALRMKQQDSERLIQEQRAIIQGHTAGQQHSASSRCLSPRPPLSRDASVCGEGLELIDETCEEVVCEDTPALQAVSEYGQSGDGAEGRSFK